MDGWPRGSKGQTREHGKVSSVLVFPALFAAGMSLIDTTDNVLMLGAYGWAFVKPIRKIYYNMTITGLSVFVALFIGTVEILGLISQEYDLSGGFWAFTGNFDINKAGFVIVGIFVLTWAAALAIWHFGKIEQKWDLAAANSGADEDPGPGGPESERLLAQVPGGC